MALPSHTRDQSLPRLSAGSMESTPDESPKLRSQRNMATNSAHSQPIPSNQAAETPNVPVITARMAQAMEQFPKGMVMVSQGSPRTQAIVVGHLPSQTGAPLIQLFQVGYNRPQTGDWHPPGLHERLISKLPYQEIPPTVTFTALDKVKIHLARLYRHEASLTAADVEPLITHLEQARRPFAPITAQLSPALSLTLSPGEPQVTSQRAHTPEGNKANSTEFTGNPITPIHGIRPFESTLPTQQMLELTRRMTELDAYLRADRLDRRPSPNLPINQPPILTPPPPLYNDARSSRHTSRSHSRSHSRSRSRDHSLVRLKKYALIDVPCPFSDARAAIPPAARANGSARQRRFFRRILTDIYVFYPSALLLAQHIIALNRQTGSTILTWEEATLLHWARALDFTLLEANGGSWTLWSEPVVDCLLRGFLEMAIRANVDHEPPPGLDPTTAAKLRRLKFGKSRDYGPIPKTQPTIPTPTTTDSVEEIMDSETTIGRRSRINRPQDNQLPQDITHQIREDPEDLPTHPHHNKRFFGGVGWPPCWACQPPYKGDILSNAAPPLLLPPPPYSVSAGSYHISGTQRRRKLRRYRSHMAESLRPLLLALHGLHQGRTFAPTPMSACHWHCALPLHKSQWRHFYNTPLSQHIRQLTEVSCRPRIQGITPPKLLSTHTDPYNPTPHLHVHKSLAKAHLMALPTTPIHSLPFPSLLPPNISAPYLSPDTLISQDPENWKRATQLKLLARLPTIEYGRLLLRLFILDMARTFLKEYIKVQNGIQLVWKDSQEQRLIFDGRPVNFILQPPPPVTLPHPTDLQTLQLAPRDILIMAKLDLDAYYHRLAVPLWLAPFLGIPPLPLRKIPRQLRHQLLQITNTLITEAYLYPAVTTLPMGLSHSVYIAQHIHLHLLAQLHPPLNLPLPNIPFSATTTTLSQVYIDDHCLIWRTSYSEMDQTRKHATRVINQLIQAYHNAGLPVKHSKTVLPTFSLTFLGIDLHGDSGRILPSKQQISDLFEATQWVLDTHAINIKQLQCLVGHWVWLLLLCRPLFSVLYYTYRFQQAFLTTRPLPPLWASVTNELRALMALAPLLYINLRRPHAPFILASDASESGGGAYKAYTPAIPTPDPTLQVWKDILAFPWRYQEPIIILEGRALLYAIRRITNSHHGFFRRLLIFTDNQPLAFAIQKGRSSTLKLSWILRALAASLLTASDTLNTVWLPSAMNPADSPSRVFGL